MDDLFADNEADHMAVKKKGSGIVPLLIRQILEAPENEIELFGVVYGMVCVVAIVRKVEISSTKINYILEDHSGRIEAFDWLTMAYENKSPDVKLNHYVKLYGRTRTLAGQKTLAVLKVLHVLDPNEVCTHLLEVLNARYKAEYYNNKEKLPVEMSLEFTAIQLSGLEQATGRLAGYQK